MSITARPLPCPPARRVPHRVAPAACAAAACVAAVLAVPQPAAAVETAWLVNSGNWDTGANWSAGTPGSADIAVLNIGGATLNFATSILGMRMGGGAIGGTGALTVTGPSSWTAGTMTGAGSTRFDDTLALSGNGGKAISGGRVLDLRGTTTWSGNTAANGNTIFFNNGTVNNAGSFVDANAFNGVMDTLGVTAFNNSGSYTKTGASTTRIEVAFNNTGSVAVNAGRLEVQGGTSSGSFMLAPNATLAAIFGTHTFDNATIGGAGTLEVAGGTMVVNGSSTSARLLVASGNFGGTNAFSADAAWSGGTVTGAGTTRFDGALAIIGNNGKGFSGGHVLDLRGTTTWSGNLAANGNTIAFNNGTVNNAGSFVDANAFDAVMDTLGVTAFNNSGSYSKNGNATTRIEVVLNNTGSVAVNAGRLEVWNGTSTGSFTLASGASLGVVFGTHTFSAATVSGAGTLEVAGGNVVVNGGVNSARLLISSGNLGGSGNTFSGPATWTGGTITSAGTTQFDQTLAVTGNNGKGLSGTRVLQLNGTTTWGGNTAANGNALFFNAGTINNAGTWNDTNGFSTLMDTLGVSAFNNSGTYNKLGNSTTSIEPVLNNTGQIHVNAGVLNTSAPFDNQGTVTVATGASFGQTSLFRDLVNHGLLQGTGTFDPSSGRTLLNSGRIAPATVGTTGLLQVAGNFTQASDGIFEVDLTSLASFDVLAVADSALLAGTLRVGNAGYVPVLGDTFVVMTFAQRLGNSTFPQIVAQGYDPAITFEALYGSTQVTLRVSAVPEPPALLLAALGGIALAAWRRRVATGGR